MLKLTHGAKEKNYYSLSEASQIISHNQWGVPVQGIHSETLRRTWRDSGRQHGKAIGRDIFFGLSDLAEMGYRAIDKTVNANVIELNLED